MSLHISRLISATSSLFPMASTVALTPREAEALCASNYPCPPGYCVPVGWMLSAGGVPVPPVPLGVARRMAITNPTTLSSRWSSGGIPDGIPTISLLGKPSSWISVRGRLPGTRRTAYLLRTSTRPAVGCGGAAGLSRVSWPTTLPPTLTPTCATLKSSPLVLSLQGSTTATPTTTATTAAARTTTTVASITGVGRSLTESLQHSKTSSADCYLIWPCILIFISFMYLNFQFQFGFM